MGLKPRAQLGTPRTKTPRTKAPTTTGSGRTVTGYIANLDDWRGDVVAALRELILGAAPKASESIKWSQPVFDHHGPFAYIRAFGKHINVGFWRGADLDDPKGALAGSGSKMRHIKLTSAADIDKKVLKALVKQAAKLNKAHGDPTR
jgi:hypothetical protein